MIRRLSVVFAVAAVLAGVPGGPASAATYLPQAWVQQASLPGGFTSRWDTASAPFPPLGEVVLFGGAPALNGQGWYNDTWIWKGTGGLLWRSTSQGAAWGPAAAMPLGAIGTKLAAVGQSNGVVDVFWRGSDHQLWHSRFYPQNSSWTRPHDLGGSLR